MKVVWFFFWMVFLCPVSYAVDVQDATETCTVWAEEAFHSAEARDKGWDKAKQREMIDIPYQANAIEEENYWQFRLIIDTVFKNPKKSPAEIQKVVMLDCLKKLGVVRPA